MLMKSHRGFIEKIYIQGFRSVSHEEPLEIDLAPLTIFIGGVGAGKSTLIKGLVLLGEMLCEKKPQSFTPASDIYAGRKFPALLAYHINKEIMDATYQLNNLVQRFQPQQALQLIQTFREAKMSGVYAPVLALELDALGKHFVLPFVDVRKVIGRRRESLRQIAATMFAELLAVAEQHLEVLSQLCNFIEYTPAVVELLPPVHRGVPKASKSSPSYYYYSLLTRYASDDEFRDRFKTYMYRVLGFEGVRLQVGEESGQLILRLELYDSKFGDWVGLESMGSSIRHIVPLLLSMSLAREGGILIASNVGCLLDPYSARSLTRALVETVARGVQVVMSAPREDIIVYLLEEALEHLGEDKIAVYVAVRKRSLHLYKLEPGRPLRGPREALEELKSRGYLHLIA